MPLDFMSPQQFDAGGPQPSAAGGAAGGFGQLAQVLAQGPRIHAQAAYMAAEADKARAETQGLTANQAIQQGVISRQQEGIALASDPETARDPAKMQRLYAIGMADPTIAPHLTTVLAATMALAAHNGILTQRQSDAFSGATGVAPYGSTQSGVSETLANTLADTRLKEAGATGRTVLQEQGAYARAPIVGRSPTDPPGTPPHIIAPQDEFTTPVTPVSSSQQQAEGVPIPTVPPGSPPGTKPTYTPTGTVSASPGQYTPLGPTQQAQEAAPVSVMGPNGPGLMGTGTATATNQQPVLGGGPGQVQGVGIQATAWPSGRGPITLPSALAGDGSQPSSTTPAPSSTTPAPASSSTAPTISLGGNPQPPPAPTSPPAPSLPNTFGNAAFGSTPTPPPPAPAQPPSPAARVGQASVEATGGNLPQPVNADETAKRQETIQNLGAIMYPQGTGLSGGMAGTLGPQAQAAIMRRASELAGTRGSPLVNNWAGAVTRAKEELQANGQLPPDAAQSADWARTAHITGKNVIELQPPGTYRPVTQQGTPGQAQGQAQTTTGFKQAPDGTYWRQTGPNQWVKADAQGNPLGAAPGVATAALNPASATPAPTSTGAPGTESRSGQAPPPAVVAPPPVVRSGPLPSARGRVQGRAAAPRSQ